MSSLVDMDEDSLVDNLEGHIYYNPLVSSYEVKPFHCWKCSGKSR